MASKRELKLNKSKYSNMSYDQIAKELEKDGLSIFSWSDRAGATYAAHKHPHDEVIVVIEGAIEFKIDETTYKMESGDELILPKDTVHSALVSENSHVSYLICS